MTLEGHHAVVKGRQDLLSSAKCWYHILASFSETRPCTLSLYFCLSGEMDFKKCSVSFLTDSVSFLGTSLPEGADCLPSQLPHIHCVLGGGDPGRKAGGTTEGTVTSDVHRLSKFWPFLSGTFHGPVAASGLSWHPPLTAHPGGLRHGNHVPTELLRIARQQSPCEGGH